MSRPDLFALNESGLNGFLFATVGTELNGSSLTVLSALARLGEDPWAKAASWARMPRAGASSALAACITQMPLSGQDLDDVHATAARLAGLLPSKSTEVPTAGVRTRTATLRAVQMSFACAAIAIGLAVAMSHMAVPNTAAATPLVPSQAVPPR